MKSIPLVVLGGSDRRPGRLPDESGQHPLALYKGAELRLGGRMLADVVIERFRSAPEVGPCFIAGPRRVYGHSRAADEIIDTDGGVGDNVRAAVEALRYRFEGRSLAFTPCDILPDRTELAKLMADYRASRPCDAWYPLVRAPSDPRELGAFGWKPKYFVVPGPGERPVPALPGHLMIFDPRALRLHFIYDVLDLAYRTRNRDVDSRRSVLVRTELGRLLYHDLLHILRLRLPTLTFTVLRSGLRIARMLERKSIELDRLERLIADISVRARHRWRHPRRGIHIPLVDALSLAKDIDTEEEAAQAVD